jgi:hypothetical protein
MIFRQCQSPKPLVVGSNPPAPAIQKAFNLNEIEGFLLLF